MIPKCENDIVVFVALEQSESNWQNEMVSEFDIECKKRAKIILL